MNTTRLSAVVLILFAGAMLTGCGQGPSNGDQTTRTAGPGPGATATSPALGTVASGAPSSDTAIALRCMTLTAQQASEVMGMDVTFGPSADYPCGGEWGSDVAWEQGEGGPELAGTPANAAISVDFADFPNTGAATTQFQAWRAAIEASLQDETTAYWFQLEPVDTSGDADAFVFGQTQDALDSAASGYPVGEGETLHARCHARVFTISVSKSVFYLTDDPFQENTIQRSTTTVDVRDELHRAFAAFGNQMCAGDAPSSQVIGQYTPPPKAE